MGLAHMKLCIILYDRKLRLDVGLFLSAKACSQTRLKKKDTESEYFTNEFRIKTSPTTFLKLFGSFTTTIQAYF
jgi:hypothetical protein